MNASQNTVWVWVIVTLIDLATRIAAIIIIPRNRKASAAMAWLLAVFLIPYVGIFFFLLIGSSKLPRKRRDKQERINRLISEGVAGMNLDHDHTAWPAWFASVVELNTRLGAVPIIGGNTARLIGDYNASIAAMTAAIRTSTTFVHVEFYIQKAQAGIAVAGTHDGGHRPRRQRHQRDLSLRLVQRNR